MVRNAKANYIKEQLELCRGDSKKCWYNISKILPDSKKKLQVFNLKGAPSIPETYLLSSVAWGLNLRVG